MTPFVGLSAFPVTPSDTEGRVDVDHFQRLVSRLVQDGVASVGALGSTGGYMYFNPSEKARAYAAAVEAAGATPVIAGIGAMHTAEAVANARAAEAAGAQGVLLAPVQYMALTDDEIVGLFSAVTGAIGIPVLIYNAAGKTGISVSEQLIARLAATDGVAAVKNPPAPEGDFAGQLARLRITTPEGFSLGYSGDSSILGALRAGADAWYSVLAGTLPEQSARLWANRRNAAALAAAAEPLVPLLRTFDAYGGIRVVHETALMLDLGTVAPPPPLQPLGPSARREIEVALEAAMAAEAPA
ncbi:MAG: dihydrodipicolinate synthase family protein [Pseudomonadota bacterium]